MDGGLSKFRFPRMLQCMIRLPLDEEIALVSTICRDLGLGEVTPTLLKAAHHTTLLASPLMVVARVQSSKPIDLACRMAARELAVAHHLAKRGAPSLRPLDGIEGPHVVNTSVVTLWPFLAQARTADEEDATIAAASLAFVHRALSDYGGELAPYTASLEHCWEVLTDDRACPALSGDDRQLLKMQFRQLRSEVEGATDAWVPLHGDAHLGNLLLADDKPIWVDFEDTCIGPREYDIACLPCSAWSHFPGADQTLIRRYADLRSVCVAVWCWADISRSNEVSEAAEYHLSRVRALGV
jgi:hypothetical protein